MYLPDSIQKTLRDLNKITNNEVVQKQGDVYVAINVITSERRILDNEKTLIESLRIESLSHDTDAKRKQILKG